MPTLITDDGAMLYDSPVICEYLDSVGSAPKLFPPAGPGALEGDLPGGAGRRHPRRHPAAPPRDRPAAGRRAARRYIELQQGKVKRAARRAREGRRLRSAISTTIGEITIGCALGYLDFRYANEPWRPGHPKLEAWYAKVVKLPPLAETMPVG